MSREEKNTVLIAVHCGEPDENCFCSSMKLEKSYDLYFYDTGREYYIDMGSEKGASLVNHLPNKTMKIPDIKSPRELKNKNIAAQHENHIWDKLSEECVSCGRCTMLCPNCLCFDVNDVSKLGCAKKGERGRRWDSCQLKDFTEVAGGYVFRADRAARFKHRVYHKLVYFKDKFGSYMCTGCGRCITHCPNKIDWLKAADLLAQNGKTKTCNP